ncbi:MAG: glycogen/starch/alpha-glucan phosphorylase [Lachnospiraceae bacterium]
MRKGWRETTLVDTRAGAAVCVVIIAKAGFFSSDRTIAEYDRDIWHLGR